MNADAACVLCQRASSSCRCQAELEAERNFEWWAA